MTANEYQQAALRMEGTQEELQLLSEERSRLLNGALGLCGESGDVADLVKKATFQVHALDRQKIAEKLGDVAWYLAVAANAIGYELDDVFRENIDKLSKRYPDGFDSERSIHCDEHEDGTLKELDT